ncbi:uncharacterized protein PSFLO_04575 [Pseudozyma flocculosa]|uniref:Uncharacterized protein n=1 Tax=Pseudozyma flocculosa TaxID=84751 RepID=A0A5C3F544_9BASI|nr:uncharacterized protein PSFLO_04575 [Pseudozyma flocculosa]
MGLEAACLRWRVCAAQPMQARPGQSGRAGPKGLAPPGLASAAWMPACPPAGKRGKKERRWGPAPCLPRLRLAACPHSESTSRARGNLGPRPRPQPTLPAPAVSLVRSYDATPCPRLPSHLTSPAADRRPSVLARAHSDGVRRPLRTHSMASLPRCLAAAPQGIDSFSAPRRLALRPLWPLDAHAGNAPALGADAQVGSSSKRRRRAAAGETSASATTIDSSNMALEAALARSADQTRRGRRAGLQG